MTQHLFSKDFVSNLLCDKLGQYYIIKQKIVWGDDDLFFNVTAATPLPVTGSFTAASGFSSLGQSTPKVVTVTTSSTTLLSLNLSRVYAHIRNSSSLPLWIQYSSPAVVGEGIRLLPNSVWIISTSELFLGQINAISTGSVNINVLEGVT